MRRPRTRHWRWLLRARLWWSGPMLLVALWLPGFNEGFPAVDTGLYAGLSRTAAEALSEPGGLAAWWHGTGPQRDYFNKPPLAFWLHGGFIALADACGLSPDHAWRMWVLRVPSLLAGVACLLATTALARSLAGHRTALLASIVLATTLEFFRYTKAISLDLWLAALAVGALAAVAGGRTPRRWILAGALLGLALLVKPWLALLPFALLSIWAIAAYGPRQLRGIALAAAAMAAVAMPWHLSMLWTYGDAWISEYLMSQSLARITTDAHGSAPWHYYFSALARWHWPWLPFVLLAAAAIARGRLAADRPATLLVLVWTIGWLAALSLSTDKATRYSVPVMPALALAAALWLAKDAPRWIARGAGRRAIGWIAPAALAASLLVSAALGPALGWRFHKPIPPEWESLRRLLADDPSLVQRMVVYPRSRSASGTVGWLTGHWPALPAPGASLAQTLDEALRDDPSSVLLLVGRLSDEDRAAVDAWPHLEVLRGGRLSLIELARPVQ